MTRPAAWDQADGYDDRKGKRSRQLAYARKSAGGTAGSAREPQRERASSPDALPPEPGASRLRERRRVGDEATVGQPQSLPLRLCSAMAEILSHPKERVEGDAAGGH
jgi:hypothetical protein